MLRKKGTILTILALIVALGLICIGCGDDPSSSSGGTTGGTTGEEEYYVELNNQSSVVVTVIINNERQETLPANPNWKTSVTLSAPIRDIGHTPDTVRYVTVADSDRDNSWTITFYDK